MKKLFSISIKILLVFLLVFLFAYQSNVSCQEKVFIVSSGQGIRAISDNLEKEGLIKNSLVFKIQAVLSGKYKQLQAGTYLINSCEKATDIISRMSWGDVVQLKVTIIEGWNLNQIAEHLEEKEIVSKQEFLTAAKEDFKQEFPFLSDKPDGSTLEGYLFPDTYSFPLDVTPQEVVKAFLVNFDAKVSDELKEAIQEQNKSLFEIIVKASLIEKEVRTYQDKELVSGIIDKRIKINMPLQIDATIAYITGKRTTRISISETQIDSPYNTYKYRGLPIGPIANPGLESIKAAVFPKESDYLFYLSKPDGETVFSRNLEEHNIAKNKYLR
jgi:UPF0755 protein